MRGDGRVILQIFDIFGGGMAKRAKKIRLLKARVFNCPGLEESVLLLSISCWSSFFSRIISGLFT